MSSCAAQSTSARAAFGGEALQTQAFPGLIEVSQVWRDGERGGTVVKPNYTSASRNFQAGPGHSLREGFVRLRDVAASSGWTGAPTEVGPLFFTANKQLAEGRAHLIIAVMPGLGTEVLVVDMTLDK